MKTLADLKRRMKPGIVVTITDHLYPELNGQRTLVNVQTQRFSMTVPEGHSNAGAASWADFPKAALLRFAGDDTVTFLSAPEWERDTEVFFTMTFPTGA